VLVVKLDARNITTLPAIGGVRTDYRDELLPGCFLRVTPQARGASGSFTRRVTAGCVAACSVRWGRSAFRTRERRPRGSGERSRKAETHTATG